MTIERLFDKAPPPLVQEEDLYTHLDLPDPPSDRPYLLINMATTVDGKIVIGEPHGSAKGVGGPTDQVLFRRLQRCVDAYIIGSTTLRASHVIYPPERPRYVVTRKGDLPLQNRFFTDAPQHAWVLAPTNLATSTQQRITKSSPLLLLGETEVDLPVALHILRTEHKIRYLLCEGGGELNDAIIRAGLADELFLTLAPHLKGGAHLPTIMGGQGYPPYTSLPLELYSLYRDRSELYLRYKFKL